MQFDFYQTHDIPEDVLQIWRNQWISMFFWYFFNPQYVAKFDADVRDKALDYVLGDEKKLARYCEIASHTSLPKRLPTPLVRKAALKHHFLLADLYFKWFYYPLIKLLKN